MHESESLKNIASFQAICDIVKTKIKPTHLMFSHNPLLKKRLAILIIALTVVFGGLIVFNFAKSILLRRFFANFQPPAVSVSSTIVKKRNWKPHLQAVGNFVAINGVDINSETSGNVVGIHFTSGQYVEANQPLIDIDDSVEQATLQFNQADLTLQEINYKRQLELLQKRATSNSSVDEARARLFQAKANLDKTQALIKQKHLLTPFAGLLGIRQINLGQFISPGQTSIVTLQSMDPLYLDFYLPEQRLSQLHAGQNITFQTEEYPNISFTGKITAINSKIDPNTHTIQVQATVPNCSISALGDRKNTALLSETISPFTQELQIACNTEKNTENHVTDYSFMPGMFASIEVEQPVQSDVLILPSTAISYTLYGNSVFIIEKTENNNLQVKRVFVETGEQDGNYTIITKGLKEGQMVVASGELKLQNGTSVTINNQVQLNNTHDIKNLGQ